MDKKVLYAVVVVVVLIIAAAAAYIVISDRDGGSGGAVSDMDGAELKVYGNINGDRYLDAADATMIQQLIDDGATAEDYPLADANRDGVLDAADIEVIDKVAAGEKTVIWHINYHDTDGDGLMDQEVVSTTFPLTSVIISASSNIAMHLFSIGVIEEVKGAAYTDGTLDSTLYGDNYLDTGKVVKIGTSVTDIPFEDGKVGASDVIADQQVTALITDWNKNYVPNFQDFENAGVDVVRISCNSTNAEEMTHTAMLLGLLFQQTERAEQYLDLNLEILNYVKDAVVGEEPAKMVASSMNGRISSGTSDYTAIAVEAGGEFALTEVDFGTSASIKISEHPEVYTYDFDYIIHFRTSLSYDQTQEDIQTAWDTYTPAFSDWEHAETGQYLVSGSVASVLRVAYIATVLHPDCVDIDRVNELHQQMVDEFFNGVQIDVDSLKFVVSAADVA